MKNALSTIAICGSKVLAVVSSIVIIAMLTYSSIVLYDTVYTSRAAFSSWDLTQYRPSVTSEEPSFEEVQEVNQDTCSWISLPGTHIDYPVVQGKDDVEYATKDIYGKSSLTGAIYLTSANERNFTDSFNIVYGHHMDNGAMFGDIDRFADETYFNQHQDGYITTANGTYDIHIFACLSADAYDSRIYSAGDRDSSDISEFLNYAKSLAVQWDDDTDVDEIAKNVKTFTRERNRIVAENGNFQISEMSEKSIKKGMQLIAFSTCADAETNGRQLLVATMKVRTEPLPEDLIEDDTVPLAVWGHGEEDHWALLNLICAIMSLLILLPGRAIVRKIRSLTKRNTQEEELETEENEELDSPSLRRRRRIGFLLQIAIAIGSVILFIWTENPLMRMIIVDEWTLVMILLFAATLFVDIFIIKYQKESKKYEKMQMVD